MLSHFHEDWARGLLGFGKSRLGIGSEEGRIFILRMAAWRNTNIPASNCETHGE